jgi:non-ribosomal peptide synthetase component E (peptide arylation enzyme)
MQNERSFGPRRVPFLCLSDLLEHQARRIPDAPAILAPGRAPLSFGRLYRHIEDVERRLRAMGIGRHDRICLRELYFLHFADV